MLDTREHRLRRAAELYNGGNRDEAKDLLWLLALAEARRASRALRLDDAQGEIVARWEKNGGIARLAAAAAAQLDPDFNFLLARLKRALLCRAIELWRSEYAALNPVAQYFFIRFGKIVRASARLSEVRGFVVPRARPSCAPGRLGLVTGDALEPLPPMPEKRTQRLRVPKGSDAAYEAFMVRCLKAAGGKLKRRALAELLARAHGETIRWPGSPLRGSGLELVDTRTAPGEREDDRLEELERAYGAWLDSDGD